MDDSQNSERPRVVVIGAGFGGLNAVKELANAPVDVSLVDRNNFHLFQPLLYQVATAGLSADQIAYPVRAIFRKQPNLDFHFLEVNDVDLETRQINTPAGKLPYDYLILAVGSETNYYGLDSVAGHGFTLKDLADAEIAPQPYSADVRAGQRDRRRGRTARLADDCRGRRRADRCGVRRGDFGAHPAGAQERFPRDGLHGYAA